MNQAMPTTQPDVPTARADGRGAPECAVCPHPWATHDRIAMRFCTATTTGQHSRGCVCGTSQDTVPAQG